MEKEVALRAAGKPVARLVPVETGKRVLTPEQQAARERMRKGFDTARGSTETSLTSAEKRRRSHQSRFTP
jgi:antitoxin (DNA-binding transcriptional repressor) of toxin-antitoxin stability system